MNTHLNNLSQKISIGISACLLGDNVRFNAGHSHSAYCTNTLSPYFEFHRFCPEVEAGFGTPRPALRLVGDPEDPQLVYSNKPSINVTEQLMSASMAYIGTLPHLDGYILMKNSPSCGMERIKVYQDNGHPHLQRTSGLFTQALRERFPLLPIEEEGRLNDPTLRENFLLRVFAHHEFHHSVLCAPSMKALIDFHSLYKYIVMAHSQTKYKDLGRLLSGQYSGSLLDLVDVYFQSFMSAISKPAERKNHCNVLMHLLGYLKHSVSSSARQDILSVIEQYRRDEINLATPITLLHHYIKHYGSQYVQEQRYFSPYPDSLGARNRI